MDDWDVKGQERLVPLDLVMDYPVEWEFWRVLRDLIQNFYDSIGYKQFHREFEYQYTSEKDGAITLIMKSRNHPFSFEWLTYFGGSTKTGKEGYIGTYGEGFKVSALCLVRMGCTFTMESQDWKLSPCIYTKEIDGRKTRMLGYHIWDRKDDGATTLIVRGIGASHQKEIEEGLLNFFYPENPLFGKELADTKDYAIYERSKMRIPDRSIWPEQERGLLYFRYLARGILPFPLIILAKTQKQESIEKRDRDTLYPFQVPALVYKVAKSMSPEDSYVLLNRLKKYWADVPIISKKEVVSLNTWYYVICQLVRNISDDSRLPEKLLQEHPNLLWLERTGFDAQLNKSICRAREWHHAIGGKEKIVSPVFRLLGVPSLREQYRTYMEQTAFITPDSQQMEMGKILADTYEQIVPEHLHQEETPPLIIIGSYKGSPMEFCRREYGKKRKRGEINRKYQVERIVMEPSDYERARFRESFLKYCMGRFRAFGTDRSDRMTMLLTHLGSWMYRNRSILEEAQKKWEAAADET